MTTVLIRLDGPIQAWGVGSSAFERRGTASAPTKSGLLGLVAACLGRERSEPVDDLAACEFAVRADQPGRPLTDFQIVGADGVYSADGRVLSQPKTSRRSYLSDAVFISALGCPSPLAERIVQALRRPVYSPFLGRKSCPPAAPLLIGTSETSPFEALAGLPYQGRDRVPGTVCVTADDPDGPHVSWDHPVSYHPEHRAHTVRHTSMLIIPLAREEPGDYDPYGINR